MKDNIEVKKCETDQEITDAKFVRHAVFVEEQGIDKNIQEECDDECDHFVSYANNSPVGAGRVKYLNKNTAKIERVAVLKDFRGQGIGKKVFEGILDNLSRKKVSEVTLDAQYHAKGFYEKFGFREFGEKFEEVGITHIVMKKKIKE